MIDESLVKVSAPTELVGDQIVSGWKVRVPASRVVIGPRFLVAAPIVTGGVGLMSRHILELFAAGKIDEGQRWVLGFLVLVFGAGYVLPLALVALSRRKSAREEITAPLPLPRYAVPVRVGLKTQEAVRGWSDGWLWFEGGWLEFRGERFDFRIRKGDIKSKGSPIVRWRNRNFVALQTPKDIPQAGLIIRRLPNGSVERQRLARQWEDLRSEVSLWETSAGGGTSIYPPLRSGVEVEPFVGRLKTFILGSLAGVLAMATLFLTLGPDAFPGRNVGGMFGASCLIVPYCLMPLFFPGSGKRLNRAVDHLQEQSKSLETSS